MFVDMATSAVAGGKLILAAARGESIPEGWLLDRTETQPQTPAIAPTGPCSRWAGPRATRATGSQPWSKYSRACCPAWVSGMSRRAGTTTAAS